MGGVHNLDWLVNKYRIQIRGKKLYFPFFTNLIDVTVVNAHVLFCLANGPIPLLDFRRQIVRINVRRSSISDLKKVGRPLLNKSANQRVLSEVRKNGIDHYFQRTEGGKQRKYAICKITPERNAVNATLVYTLNAWQHRMNDG